ncbi:MAG: uroporphyrinogen decarboxylase [Acidobacteriota bacterium]|jgi:hypothetical protein|nr:uroporphyrinogen decarboxylase [Acidobacteriota bacterium]
MLTKRQNLLETIKGGNPDRFVNQYEAFMCQPTKYGMIMVNPYVESGEQLAPGGTIKNQWGVTISWPAGVPGPFPVHDAEHKVLKDVTEWRKVVKAPNLDFPQKEWDKFKPSIEAIDRNEVFATVFNAPGIFEQTHYLMGIDSCLESFYEEPEALKELIDYITDWQLDYAKLLYENFHPDAVFQHDDWGSHLSSFISPAMFEEFLVPAYKKLYGFWKANGIELIVHHSDAYGANLVPAMIEIGIDIWQGPVTTNKTPELVKQYGGKISFMGDIDNGVIDRVHLVNEDGTPIDSAESKAAREVIAKEARRAVETNGKLYYIPCCTMGGPESSFRGVYEALTEDIDKLSKEFFK